VKRWIFLLRVMGAGIVGSFVALLRRARRGPTLPTWTWGEEIFVALSRATLTAGARNVSLMTPRGGGLKPPLGRAARSYLEVAEVDLLGVRAERYRPKADPSGTMLYLHGGGFVTGSVAMERRQAAAQAMASGCDTFSIDYRLAPKHPFPAALDDAIAAYKAVLERGADPATTIFFGGSSGACLALSSLLKIREIGLPQPAGAVLLWPYADFTFSGTTIVTNGDVDMLPVRDLAHVWGPAYVGSADPSDAFVSPALANLAGLPPLLIISGGAESLLSCAERIAASARLAGVHTQFTVYPEKVHGWMLLSKLPATVTAVNEIQDWIRARLGRDDSSTTGLVTDNPPA
jgi:acetyl esterase/lipase